MEFLGLTVNLDRVRGNYNPNSMTHAIINNDILAVKMYIDAGVDLSLKNYNKKTPLDLAIMYNNSDIINVLERSGAQLSKNRIAC